MLHDIHPHQFANQFEVAGTALPDDFILHFNDNHLLLNEENGTYALPTLSDFEKHPSGLSFFFTLNGKRCFWVKEVDGLVTTKASYQDIGFLRNLPQKEVAWVGAVAIQLKDWYLQNQYCGKCGSKTRHKMDERAIECPDCHHVIYPRISPAIIVAITSGDKILLANNVNFPPQLYSLLAGYADIGESIEQTLVREIREEVGLEVTNIRYYKSQPWPYSGSMMLGFVAEADERQPIQIDGKEIADAQWFTRGHLPSKLPHSGSIAGEMITAFERGEL